MTAALDIPQELLEEFLRGNVLVFVGEGINRGCLPLSADLVNELMQRSQYPADEPPDFPRVAGFYEFRLGRHSLETLLREKLDVSSAQPSYAHDLLAQLRPKTIVTTCYDRLLQRVLEREGIPLTTVVRNQDVAYADQQKTLFVWMWGILDQPDSLLITEDDHRRFSSKRDNLSDFFRAELARRTWLFLGVDLENEWFRGLYDNVQQGLDRHARRSYAFGASPSDYIRHWWETRNVTISNMALINFLEQFERKVAAGRERVGSVKQLKAIPADLPIAPYKRLDFYREEDSYLFFGRDEEIERMAMLIHAHRLVLLYGGSGTGKTSLLQAGVVPRLKRGVPPYNVISIRALGDLRASVRSAAARRLEVPLLVLGDRLSHVLGVFTRMLGATVLVIDQFEEFFSKADDTARQQIVDELAELYDAHALPVKIVLSFREDYLARLGELETRIPDVMRVRFQLFPFQPDTARQTIERPVELLGKRFEPTLVDRLVQDLFVQGIMPPQIQLVCSRLYDELSASDQIEITMALYKRLGGAAGILKDYLIHELRELHGQESLARSILVELIDSQGNRRVAPPEELARALSITPKSLGNVLDKLVNLRLVRPLDLEESDEIGYELTHDYLASMVVGWLDAEAVDRKRTYELVRQDVQRWRQFGFPMAESTLQRIRQQWSHLELGTVERAVILRSAIQQGRDLQMWMTYLGDEPSSQELLEELANAPVEATRLNAVTSWRYIPNGSAASKLLADVALRDPARAVRREAVVSLVHCSPEEAVESLLSGDASNRIRRVEALAHLWDEAGVPRQLSPALRSRVAVTLARIRLRQSGKLLVFYSLAGMIGGLALGMILIVMGSLADLTLFGVGTSLLDRITPWVFVAAYIAFLVPAIFLGLTATEALMKRPRHGLIVFAGALEVGAVMSIAFSISWSWSFLRGELWHAQLTGLIFGAAIGGVLAELSYRRQVTGAVPPPRTSMLMAVLAGLLAGLLTSFFPARYEDFGYFVAWLSGIAFMVVLFVGAVVLTVRAADRLLEDFMIPIGTIGGRTHDQS